MTHHRENDPQPEPDAREDGGRSTPASEQSSTEQALLQDPGEPRCAECGGIITQSDVVCPHCGVSLVAG